MADPQFYNMAVDAFEGYIRAFEVKKLKHVFNLISMDLEAVARSFGLKEKPDIDIRKFLFYFYNFMAMKNKIVKIV